MAKHDPIFTRATFQFFKELARNNRKMWMDENRERYQETVVKPFRRLLEELSPVLLQIDSRFDTTGRKGGNFSRINRDIRFAKDKTPYRAQMYLKCSAPFPGQGETGQIYMGISADTATAGFRIYSGAKRKESALAMVADARVASQPKWLMQQKKRLSKKYESYWYRSEKRGEWAEQKGWPTGPEDWQELQAWIVRRKLKPSAVTQASFTREVEKIFRDVYPLLKFTCLED